jgi:hypothetical protein
MKSPAVKRMMTLMAPAANPIPRAAEEDRLEEYGVGVVDGEAVGVGDDEMICSRDVDGVASFMDVSIANAPMIAGSRHIQMSHSTRLWRGIWNDEAESWGTSQRCGLRLSSDTTGREKSS